ncbi:M61 family metallopeptidase [Ketobacter sp.]
MQNNEISPIHYSITPSDPYAHVFDLRIHIPAPLASGQLLRLPAWIPGSYMIRDFARNIIAVQARSGDQNVALGKIDKDTWALGACTGAVDIEYQVYAWDMSVRAAHLDQTHAYFNGTSVFLQVVGQSDTPCRLDINNANIEEARHWRVATSLTSAGADAYQFGTYQAENYDELIDHPVEIGDFDCVTFEACGVPHDFVVTGKHSADLPRIAQDLTTICEHQIRQFGEPAPFERYVFMTWAVGNGYGGLEHRASTSLICNRDDLAGRNESGKVSEGYKTFLGLCSHEYFHSWNVKRIRPDIPYDLSKENHTPLLWAFEGITSYYDDLILMRTGLISRQEYLELVAKTITRLLRNPGRFKQTTAQSSFDAWTKFYKQDENAANAIVSYYTKGAVIALALDLNLRHESNNKLNLDQVMSLLWQRHGQTGVAVAEFDIQNLCLELCRNNDVPQPAQQRLQQFFEDAVYGTTDMDFSALFAPFGIAFKLRQAGSMSDAGGNDKNVDDNRVDLGVLVAADAAGSKVTRALDNSSAQCAGISAGDVLIAVDGLRVENGNLEKLLSRFQPGDQLTLHGFRRDELMTFEVTLKAPLADTVYLAIEDESKLARWL